MKKLFTKVFVMAALLVAGAAFVSCDKENIATEYTMTVVASKGDDGAKQLVLDGHTLTASWAMGERVTVYNETKSAALEGYLEAQSAGASTTLSGTLEGDVAENDVLTLKFLSPDYDNQDGTIEYIDDNCDYATATVTVASVNGGNITTTADAEFVNQQAIVKFTLLDKDNSDAALTTTQLLVSNGTNSYTVTTTTPGTNVLYVAMQGFSGEPVTLATAVGNNPYYYGKSDVTFANGKYYEITVKMTKEVTLATPLTIEAITAGIIQVNNPKSGMKYSTNGGTTKTTISENPTAITVAAGDKVQFYGDGVSIPSYSGTTFYGSTAQAKVYGNIMSLVNEFGYLSATTLTGTNTFRNLFNNYANLKDASDLLLPATTLNSNCYDRMFFGCSGLTSAPALPATTLANNCYTYMFYNCSSLTTAPVLPATSLAGNCYNMMFGSCTSLTTAPLLPATALASGCYAGMFTGCTGLTTAPVLPATTLAIGCYANMFNNCTNLTTAPELPVTTMASECYREMFNGCTSLETAPVLPATNLTNSFSCYQSMFNGCTSLTTAPALPATTLAASCYRNMFSGCTSLTTAPELPATELIGNCYTGMFTNCSNLSSVTCMATGITTSNNFNYTASWLSGAGSNVSGTKTLYTNSTCNWNINNSSGIPTGWTREDLY